MKTFLASGLILGLLIVIVQPCRGASEWSAPPSWSPVSIAEVRANVVALLKQVNSDVHERDKFIDQWQALSDTAPPDIVLDLVATTAAAVHVNAAALVEHCRETYRHGELPDVAWLQDTDLPEIYTRNLRLYAARWLMQEGFYDEAIDLIANLEAGEVVDPAALLFCKTVCHQQLVEIEQAEASARQLLERAEEIPTRYEQLATLIAEDVKAVEEDSLDHIARRMNNVRRRLDLALADNEVIDIENDVVESLDKLIEELEEQRRQQQQQQQAGGGQSSNPMQDSMLPQGPQGPGHVDRRDVGDGSGWGAINDKQREEALQDIGREFPAHYRDVIEQYFKKIAAEDVDEP